MTVIPPSISRPGREAEVSQSGEPSAGNGVRGTTTTVASALRSVSAVAGVRLIYRFSSALCVRRRRLRCWLRGWVLGRAGALHEGGEVRAQQAGGALGVAVLRGPQHGQVLARLVLPTRGG